jgi:L-malate glycosyltransferase
LQILTSKGGELENEFKKLPLKINYKNRRKYFDLKFLLFLRKYLKDNNIDIIHFHNDIGAFYGYYASKGLKTKNIFSIHGFEGGQKGEKTYRYFIPKVDGCIFVTKSFMENLKNKYKFVLNHHNYILKNALDFSRFNVNGTNLKKELGIEDDCILLGMIGNFYFKAKDQITICKAMPEIIRQNSKVRLVFIGGKSNSNPELFGRCIRECKLNGTSDKVYFTGLRDDVPSIIKSLDIFLFSSREDSFGISVLEAMISGIPAVVSDISALREVTSDGKYALLFKKGDEKDLAEKVLYLIRNNVYKNKLINDSYNWALNEYSLKKYITQLENIYLNIISNN